MKTSLIFLFLFAFIVVINARRNHTHERLCEEQFPKIQMADYRFVHGFGVGFENLQSEEMKIIFRVYKKVPIHWLPIPERIPRDFNGCRTKVIESPPMQDHGRKLIGGSQITTFGFNRLLDKTEGTIGIIRKKNQTFEGITNFHVVMDPPKLDIGNKVIHPPKLDGTQDDVIGAVLRAAKGADCAIISIQKQPEYVVANEVRQIGIVDSSQTAFSREHVVMYSPLRRSVIEGLVIETIWEGSFLVCCLR